MLHENSTSRKPARRGMKTLEKRYCVYAIKSAVTDRINIGQSNCLKRRLQEHNYGRVKSTKFETPWELFAIDYFEHHAKARWLEKSLKKSKEISPCGRYSYKFRRVNRACGHYECPGATW